MALVDPLTPEQQAALELVDIILDFGGDAPVTSVNFAHLKEMLDGDPRVLDYNFNPGDVVDVKVTTDYLGTGAQAEIGQEIKDLQFKFENTAR